MRYGPPKTILLINRPIISPFECLLCVRITNPYTVLSSYETASLGPKLGRETRLRFGGRREQCIKNRERSKPHSYKSGYTRPASIRKYLNGCLDMLTFLTVWPERGAS